MPHRLETTGPQHIKKKIRVKEKDYKEKGTEVILCPIDIK